MLDLVTAGRCDVQVADAGPFGNWSGDRREIRLGAGDIAPRGSSRIVLRHNCSNLSIREWWWLDAGGNRLGERKQERQDKDSVTFASSYLEEAHYQTVGFTTPEGEISLSFPLGLAAGETISGSLRLTAGGDVRVRQRNFGELRRYSVDVGAQDIPGDRQQWTRALAAEVPSGYLDITLWDPVGNLVSANVVPVQPAGSLAAVEQYRLPFLSHAGQPLRISGPFDGDTNNSTVTVGGAALVPLAESPRAFVGLAPAQIAGMVEVEIREAGVTARGTLRNVVLEVRSPKDTIASGERLRMELVVRGLEGLDQPLTVGVVNQTIGLAHFLGDPRHAQFTISPEGIENGQIAFPLEMEGSLGGTFRVEPRLEVATP